MQNTSEKGTQALWIGQQCRTAILNDVGYIMRLLVSTLTAAIQSSTHMPMPI